MTPAARYLPKEINMMNFKAFAMWLVVVVPAAFPAPASAGCLDLGKCWPNCIAGFCCDDYCPKPAPSACRVCCFSCNDYCPKSPPCVRGICGTCCDNYCRKPLPKINCPTCRRSSCSPAQCDGCAEHGCGEDGCGESGRLNRRRFSFKLARNSSSR